MKLGLLVVLLFLASCASNKRMMGIEGRQLKGDAKPLIKISGVYNSELSQERYHLIDIFMLNEGSAWERIKQAWIVEVKGVQEFHIIKGEDLKAWKKSMILDFDLKNEEAKKNKKPLPPQSTKVKILSLDANDYFEAPIALPGKFQTKKWLLIQTPENASIEGIVLDVTYMDSSAIVYEINVKGTSI